MRYARTREGDMFKSTTAVIMQELCKTLTALSVILYQEGSLRAWGRHLYDNTIGNPMDCLKICVPSLLYVMQNNLLYVGISNLEAATFQITYQLKILTTALFSVVMLRKKLSPLQWVALLLLFVGVSVVQLTPSDSKNAVKIATEQNPMKGLIAVIICCCISGFAGVYFEKMLKGTPQTLWLRNVQLGTLGMVIGTVTLEINDGEEVHKNGFFFGYDWIVWVVIGISAFGGLMVAVGVKYADNILKGFATSAAIVLSCIASMYFFDFALSLQFTVGAALVISSVFMYSKFALPPPTPVAPPKEDKTENV